MKLILETTTGQIYPAGVAPNFPRGGLESTFLQFVTNGAAALLVDGAPIALKLTQLSDPTFATPLATFNAFVASPGDLGYVASLDTLAGGLAALSRATLLARISYNSVNVDSGNFLVNYGVGSPGVGTPAVQVVISQPTGPVNYVQSIGQFGGRVTANQVEGFWRVTSPCQLRGLQINIQDAPTGTSLLVDVVKNGVAQNKIGTLSATAKNEETTFGAPLALAIGDVVQFKPTQVGSTKAGSNLDVKGIVQLL